MCTMFQPCSYQYDPPEAMDPGGFYGYQTAAAAMHHHQNSSDLFFTWPSSSSFVGMPRAPGLGGGTGGGGTSHIPPPPSPQIHGHQQHHNLFGGSAPAGPQGSPPGVPGSRAQDGSTLGGAATPQVSTGSGGLIVPQPRPIQRTIKTYHCRMCDQIFDNKSDLLVHSQQIHKADPKPYRCPQCHKCFANSSYLSQHARIHAGIKPYKCQICERRFTQLCHLQQHIRTHTGEKPYKCQHPGCGKAFSQLSNLQSHSRSHMTDKPYRCNSCYKCYADEQGLREHIPKHSETKHLKTHICHICGKSYTQETYLARHMTKHQGVDVSAAAAAAVANTLRSSGATVTTGGTLGRLDSLNMDIKPEGSLQQQLATDSRPNSAFLPLPPSSHHQFSTHSPLPVPSTFPFGTTMATSGRLPSNTLSPLGRLTPPPRTQSLQPPPPPPPTSSTGYPFSPFPTAGASSGLASGTLVGTPGGSRELGEPHGNMMANTLLSLQQFKNFNTPHPVFPKSEPSSPALHKDFS